MSYNFKSIDVPAAEGTYTYIGVTGVDASGEAVGYYGYVDGDDDGYWHGFTATTSNGVTFDPPGSTSTDVNGVTANGELFGDYTYLNKQYGFVDNSGVITTITLGDSSSVYGITPSGEIFGTFADFGLVSGFVDNNGTYSLVDVSGAAGTSVVGINASGEIVGTYTDSNYVSHGFEMVGGVTTDINAPGAYATSVVGISNDGTIVGNFQDTANYQHAFIDRNGVITQFDAAGAVETTIDAINSSGEFVGWYLDGAGHVHGFTDDHGVVTTVDIPGSSQTDIIGIDESGDIYGYYDDSSYHQHGFVGNVVPTVISAYGSTSLVQVGDTYALDPIAGGTGPQVEYGGVAVTAGEFTVGASTWAPIGAQATATGYEVAWKLGSTNEYSVWATDSNGNYTGNLYQPGPGNALALEALETSFHQDLNGDGTIGIPAAIQIDTNAFGAIGLVQSEGNYFLEHMDTQSGPELFYQGVAVTSGEFAVGGSTWQPIGAAVTSTGYEVAWRLGNTDTYSVWATDSTGHYTSNLFQPGSGNSAAFEALETSFDQDLNGDGTIGVAPIKTDTNSYGSISLYESGNNYLLENVGTSSGPDLHYQGALVTVGEFAVGASTWEPIGAALTATGYEVAWKLGDTNDYSVWATDSSGNYTSNFYLPGPGNALALETLETSFHQDLNGDGTIGIPAPIQTDTNSYGSIGLVHSGSNYFLENIGTGTGPELSYQGAPVTAGEFVVGGAVYEPIGAALTSTGYEVAWRQGTTDTYSVWATDSNGNYTSNLYLPGPGNGAALESLETSFHQDLNGDGVIGSSATIASGASVEIAAASSVAATFGGATGSLVLDQSTTFTGQIYGLTGTGSLSSSDQIDLKDISFSAGTVASFSGNASGGVLTVSDSQHHTASITLEGNYTNSTFSVSGDGSGGTIVIDPPKAGAGNSGLFAGAQSDWHFDFTSTPTTIAPAPVTISAESDHFVFPSAGAASVAGNTFVPTFDGLPQTTGDDHLAALLHDAQTAHAFPAFEGSDFAGHDDGHLHQHDNLILH